MVAQGAQVGWRERREFAGCLLLGTESGRLVLGGPGERSWMATALL